ncbi:MAG TPA: LacI family DNA-binding transcriptional regulator [Sphaerochaeta sp.]|jgi:LacI family transcriptional regulator|nr:LacI family DNA-binding transcriptional regulator [Sphaerochaeta sp.]
MGIKDIAKDAGVSVATVSRVLNNTKFVSEELRQKVLSSIERQGYVADHIARSMVLKKTFTIGLIIPAVSEMYHQMIFSSVEETLEAHRYKVLVCRVQDTLSNEQIYVDLLMQNRVDGIILMHESKNPQIYTHLKKAQVPIVLAGIDIPGLQVPQVRIDDLAAAMDGTNHLLRLGHRKIALIMGSGYSVGDKRLAGYKRALEEAGVSFDDSLLQAGGYTLESGYDAMNALLSRHGDLDAVFALSDEMAAGAMHAAFQQGIDIPHDISLLGFDGITLAAYTNPKLTTVSQPICEIGEKAAQLLLKMLESNEVVPKLTIMAHTIQQGDSCLDRR